MHWYDIPILLLLLVSVVGLPLGLLFLFFKRKRPLGKQISIASGIGLICSVVLIAVLADRSARDEGFKDAADKRAAREQGFNDPKQWAVFRDKAEGTTRLAAQQSAVQDSRVETGKREVQSRREDATTTVAGAGSKQKQSTGTAEPIALPQSQTRFLLAVEAGRAAYTAGSNDLAKGAARPAGADAICAALGGPQIVGGSRDLQYSINLNATDWYGSVATLSSNNDGKGVLSIEIGKNIYVKTWNNIVSDAGFGTLIEPSSVIHSIAAGLRARQKVRFSGVFFRGPQDCIRESSLTIDGSLREPEFIMHFTRLSATP